MDETNWTTINCGSTYFLNYEPGNGTLYVVLVSKVPRPRGLSGFRTVLSLVNFRTCMEWVDHAHESYVEEKLNILPGDAVAICELMRNHNPFEGGDR